jgi:hypothetical protein
MRFAAVLIALTSLGCGLTGPSDDLSGLWLANSGGRFAFVEMNLQQSGDTITGTACADSDGHLLYRGAPVHGDFPDLEFTVSGDQPQPCCGVLAGSVFRGRQDSSKDIVGTYRGVDIRFKRSSTSICPM